ncbi:MAG: DegV family protein [Chloroflexi bacterium]|nr:DegV family protein [Chloroflexota bacterium]
MQIVTDSGTDVQLSLAERAALNIYTVPLVVSLNGASYREGLDIEPQVFYRELAATGSLPITSQPSPGALAEVYRDLARKDPDILSIHISSGLSGTVNSARAAAAMVPEARVTVVDTKTLSAASGWQVEAAARAARAGWSLERILALTAEISAASDSLYTLRELRYLIHGGRIGHMKGLLAQLLNIKPIIGVEKEGGTYVQRGQARSIVGAMGGLVKLIERQHGAGARLRVQVMHSADPEGARALREAVAERFSCVFAPDGVLSLVLGAHTGPSLVAVAFASADVWSAVP